MGALFLIVSIAASLVLALKHLGAVSIPGCGPGSACDQLAATIWGKVPVVEWPTVFVGLAYFGSALAAWLTCAGRASSILRYVVRLGVLLSAGFIGIMLVGGHWCVYCLGAHAGHFAFWLVMERSPRPTSASAGPAGMLGGSFAALTLILVAVNWQGQRLAMARAEEDRAASTGEIIRRSGSGSGESPQQDQATAAPDRGFTGRWRHGPEAAPVRIVIFSDYQCKECNKVEEELREIMKTRTDVSLSPKHFPFCRPCNPNIPSDMHENACWAARAAETAGILRGNAGFWQMHNWLFDRAGGFTTEELNAALAEMGYNAAEFLRIMQSDDSLKPVQADVAEAMGLGLHYTPMVFINGVEMRGWHLKNAVTRTIEEVARSNPPPRTAAADHPPRAPEKYLEDWRVQDVRAHPADTRAWSRGPREARVRVVLWGDYQQGLTADVDRAVREVSRGGVPIHLTYRHFPLNESCNPSSSVTKFELACRLAEAAEAAGSIAGEDGYWAMHDWLLAHQDSFTAASSAASPGDRLAQADDILAAAARELGLDPQRFREAMDAEEVKNAITEDAVAAKKIGITGIPFVHVNGKFVPRWRLEGEEILQKILREAAGP
jgi:predicted DsbA family dithiol-disulfide isomerase